MGWDDSVSVRVTGSGEPVRRGEKRKHRTVVVMQGKVRFTFSAYTH